MFTDDKMEEAYQKNHIVRDAIEVLLQTLPQDGKISKVELRRANNICKLWLKRHPQFIEDLFEKVMIMLNPDKAEIIHELLK